MKQYPDGDRWGFELGYTVAIVLVLGTLALHFKGCL